MKTILLDRHRRIDRLSKRKEESLAFDLVHALVATKSLEEAALFLQDLLTKSELRILGKRLRIAKLLLEGKPYQEIEGMLCVSHGTIAKISAWMAERGDGFRNIIKKLPNDPDKEGKWIEDSEWNQLKRRYSLYFWPELLLEEIVKGANQKQKNRIKNLLQTVDEKNELHKRLKNLLKD